MKHQPWGAGGHPNNNVFLELKPHATFQNPRTPPYGRIVTKGERDREEREKKGDTTFRESARTRSFLFLCLLD